MKIPEKLVSRGYLFFVVPICIFLAWEGVQYREVHVPTLYTVASAVGLIVGFSTLFELGSVLREPFAARRFMFPATLGLAAWYLIFVALSATQGQVRLVPHHWSFWCFPIALSIVCVVQAYRQHRATNIQSDA